MPFTIRDFREGNRVMPAAGTHSWLSGERYGTVINVGREDVYCVMDRSHKYRRFTPDKLLKA